MVAAALRGWRIEATGELALGAVHLAVQVIAPHAADHVTVQVRWCRCPLPYYK